MTHRKEVEALLAEVKVHTGRKAGLVAELCRTWLAVQDAPTGQSLGVVIYHDDERFAAHNERKRVRLLALDSGGAGEVGGG